MSKIPTPDRGQPLDVSYIYQLAEAINELAATTSSATYKYAAIDTSNGVQNSLITETKIVAGEKIIYQTATTVTADSTVAFSYPFKGEFKYAPIVTASPVLLEGTASGQNVTVTLQSITTARVDGTIRFNTAGSVAVKVNLIAVGVPV
jgi:hypothetical protein